MTARLDKLITRRDELTDLLSDPDVTADQKKFADLSREFSEVDAVAKLVVLLREAQAQMVENRQLMDEPDCEEEIREMAEEEIRELNHHIASLEQDIQRFLIPKDPNDARNVIIEIRAGTGGDEAALFAANLFRMYVRYAEKHKFKTEILSSSEIGLGGYKEVIAQITGTGAYSRYKFESGVHRVQHVPETETSGRIHTSACTVAVLPEADDVEVNIKAEDIRVDVYRSSGPGGQSVNTTDSAVRLTYIPTGMVVICQDEKSQHKNKAKAMKVLQARLLDQAQQEAHKERADARKSMVGSGDRSERIRTYNFPQGRITDHRLNLSLYKLDAMMMGELDELIDGLLAHHQAIQLGQSQDTG